MSLSKKTISLEENISREENKYLGIKNMRIEEHEHNRVLYNILVLDHSCSVNLHANKIPVALNHAEKHLVAMRQHF